MCQDPAEPTWPRPLAGITVVSFERAVAAPLATRHLADLGARVIKVEPPGAGDFARNYDDAVHGESSFFVWLNRGKKSVTVNLSHDDARPVVTGLVGAADVVVHNMTRTAAERVGLDPDALRARDPTLVVAVISGYGDTGPYAGRRAYDLLVQAESGILSVTGTPEQPSKVGASIADVAAGMYTYSGVLAALYARARSGVGASIEVSMLEALAEWLGPQILYGAHAGATAARSGAHHATIAPYGPYRAADGVEVFLAVQNDAEWARLCEVLTSGTLSPTDPRFATNVARVRNRSELDAALTPALGRLNSETLCAALDRHRVAWSLLRDAKDVLTHPQLRARGRWVHTDTPSGPAETLTLPGLAPSADAATGPVPSLGEHTDEILSSMGFRRERIQALRRTGAIG
jgi:formyl-CoA transferase